MTVPAQQTRSVIDNDIWKKLLHQSFVNKSAKVNIICLTGKMLRNCEYNWDQQICTLNKKPIHRSIISLMGDIKNINKLHNTLIIDDYNVKIHCNIYDNYDNLQFSLYIIILIIIYKIICTL